MLLLEIMSHSLYFNSITRYSLWQQYGAQLQLTAVDMGMISFWVLMFMWLKVSFCLHKFIHFVKPCTDSSRAGGSLL